MKHIIMPLLLLIAAAPVATRAQTETGDQHYQQAYHQLAAMLEDTTTLHYERAVFLTENAWHNDTLSYKTFTRQLAQQASLIKALADANHHFDAQAAKGQAFMADFEKPDVVRERYRRALMNWAVYQWMTDTTELRNDSLALRHVPFTYNASDPYGTIDWTHTHVTSLLQSGRGNCYSLASLFKILSDRLQGHAALATAPHHVYIRHADPKGDVFNVELSTRTFPGSGTLMTLTYTTREALKNNLSLRSLTDRQAVALCLVYLAKGYEHRFHAKGHSFLLQCAETALRYDSLNLNALLLKAQVLEHRVALKQSAPGAYEALLAKLHAYGYRPIPDALQHQLMAHRQGVTTPPHKPSPVVPQAASGGMPAPRYATLSHGAFDEQHRPQPYLRVGRTIFDTRRKKIARILPEDTFSSYEVDPVVSALSVDPLTASYPWYTPYQFAGNSPIMAIDLDGLEEDVVVNEVGKSASTKLVKETSKSLSKLAVNSAGKLVSVGGNVAKFGVGTVFSIVLFVLTPVNGRDDDPSIKAHQEFQERNREYYELQFLEGQLTDGLSHDQYDRYFDLLAKLRGIYIDKNGTIRDSDARTNYLRQRAVDMAWRIEKELVELTGEGSVRWKATEIQELLKTGKVKGYEGHHINNVNSSPEMAANPDNIKFVKGRRAHLTEHDGNFSNNTSGPLIERSKRLEEVKKKNTKQ